MSVGIMALNMDSKVRKPPCLNSIKSNFSIDSIMSSTPADSREARLSGSLTPTSRAADVSTVSSPPPMRSHRPVSCSPDAEDTSGIERISAGSIIHSDRMGGDSRLFTDRVPDPRQSPPSSPQSDTTPVYKSRVSTPPLYRPYPPSASPHGLHPSRPAHLPPHHRHLHLLHHKQINGLSGLKSLPPHLTPPYHPSQLSALDQINALYAGAQQNSLAALAAPTLPCGPFNGAAPSMTMPGLHKPFSMQPSVYAPFGSSRHGFMYPSFPGADPGYLLPFRKPKRIRTAFSPSQLLKLEHAFEKNHYVVGQERKELAANLSLTETQVKVWFQNRRTKFKRIRTDDGEYVTIPEGEDHSDLESDDEELDVDDGEDYERHLLVKDDAVTS